MVDAGDSHYRAEEAHLDMLELKKQGRVRDLLTDEVRVTP